MLGNLLGGIIGGIIGFLTGGPWGAVYGFTVGFGIASMFNKQAIPDMANQIGTPTVGDRELNTCEVGTPLPDCFGTVKLNANILWTGREFAITQYRSEGNPTGIDYHAFWAVGLVEGPLDYYHTMYKGSDPTHSETLSREDAVNGLIVVNGTNQPFGDVHFYFGTNDQEPNSLLGSDMDETQAPYNIPYRNMAWVAFLDGFLGSYGYVYPSMYFVVSKFPDCSFDADNSYKIIGDYDYNPAHAVWYLLKKAGIPDRMLNSASFLEKAAVLYGEGLGISAKIDSSQNEEFLSFIESIMNHIRGYLLFNENGEICLDLIRYDYDESSLFEITEDMFVEDPVFTKGTYVGTTNAVGVQFTERLGTANYLVCEWLYDSYNSYTLIDEEGFANFVPYPPIYPSGGPSLNLVTGLIGNAIQSVNTACAAGGCLYSPVDFSQFNVVFSYTIAVKFDWDVGQSGVQWSEHELLTGYAGIDGWHFGIRQQNDHHLYAFMYVGDSDGVDVDNYDIVNGEWFRITFVVDMNDGLKIYKGTTEIASSVAIKSEVNFGTGYHGDGVYPYWSLYTYNSSKQTMAVDEGRFYNKALTISDISSLSGV